MSADDLMFFTSAAVGPSVHMRLLTNTFTEDDTVSIMFGQDRITLDFTDADSLQRLGDLAHEGAQRLRAAADAG
ncbi:hypothetical protein [Actinokineospora pegani]|uniref:hypothetical protein n=1 Tax=Actinokineospora pegani TaxID=2654637 RepID=UPI0012EAEF62|nr:hypothetical protein [Actinokineospora pegani]